MTCQTVSVSGVNPHVSLPSVIMPTLACQRRHIPDSAHSKQSEGASRVSAEAASSEPGEICHGTVVMASPRKRIKSLINFANRGIKCLG